MCPVQLDEPYPHYCISSLQQWDEADLLPSQKLFPLPFFPLSKPISRDKYKNANTYFNFK